MSARAGPRWLKGATSKPRGPRCGGCRTWGQATMPSLRKALEREPKYRRHTERGWPSHPVGICTMCGAPIEDPRFINERCIRRVGGRRCKGTYGITMSPRDHDTYGL